MRHKMTLQRCEGCRNDFYNYNNPMGGKLGCWSFDSAVVELRKEVPIDQLPPWKQKAKLLPSCYRKSGCVYVGKDVTC